MMDREQMIFREYQEQMRRQRIKQVRALEKRISSQKVQKFVELNRRKKQNLIRQLKHEWEEDRQVRVAELEEECAIAVSNIGNGHLVAARLAKDKINCEKIHEAYAQEQHILKQERYKEALQKEFFYRDLIEGPQRAANKRRKTREIAACFERSLARFTSHALGTKEKKTPSTSTETVDPVKLADFKHTYFHSSSSSKPTSDSTSTGSEMQSTNASNNAWRAANMLKKALERQKEKKAEIDEVLRRRITLRGQAAASRIFMRKRIEKLQRELEMVQRREAEKRKRLVYILPKSSEGSQEEVPENLSRSNPQSEDNSQMQKESYTQTEVELTNTISSETATTTTSERDMSSRKPSSKQAC